jgi:hypothetical protein
MLVLCDRLKKCLSHLTSTCLHIVRYRFRLTFHRRTSGFFAFDQESTDFPIADGLNLRLTARDADSLSQATRFHFEAGGFSTEAIARTTGERLRLRLRILNSMLDLGMTIPTSDTRSGGVSEAIKNKALEETGGIAMDNVVGLAVFQDDGKHFEYVMAGVGTVYPSDPTFLFKALAKSWLVEMQLEERTLDALEILSRATTETSDRAKFLLMYLAVERLIQRGIRSDAAQVLIADFQERVRTAGLDQKEADSLVGALGTLKDQSFPSALFALVERMASPRTIQDTPLREFLSACVTTRNKIAHNAVLDPSTDLNKLSAGLRQFAMMMIWTINRIPDFSVDVPASTISVPSMHIRVR